MCLPLGIPPSVAGRPQPQGTVHVLKANGLPPPASVRSSLSLRGAVSFPKQELWLRLCLEPGMVLLGAPLLSDEPWCHGSSGLRLLRAAWLTCACSLRTSPLGSIMVSIIKPASLSQSHVLGERQQGVLQHRPQRDGGRASPGDRMLLFWKSFEGHLELRWRCR